MDITYTVSNHYEQNTSGEFVHTGYVGWDGFKTFEDILAANARHAEYCKNELIRNELVQDKDGDSAVEFVFKVRTSGKVILIRSCHVVADSHLPA